MKSSNCFNNFFDRQCVLLSAMLFMVTGVSISESVYAVDPSQLWLPRNYSRYPRELKQAADVAETTQRCMQVVAGTVSTKHSDPDHPVFKIICRDEKRKTFPWLIDGFTMDIINKPKGQEVVPLKESVVEKNIEEPATIEASVEKIVANIPKPPEPVVTETIIKEDAKEDAVVKETVVKEQAPKKIEPIANYQDKVWIACSYHLRERVKKLSGLSLDTEVMPSPTGIGDGGLLFETVFKAEGKQLGEGVFEELQYKAKCKYHDEDFTLEVYPAAEMPRVNPVEEDKKLTASKAASQQASGKNQSDVDGDSKEKTIKSRSSAKTAETVSNPIKIHKGDNLVDVCLNQLRKKTAALDKVVWLTEKTETTSQLYSGETGSQALEIDFDAVGPSGGALHSTGLCYFDNDEIRIAIQNRSAE